MLSLVRGHQIQIPDSLRHWTGHYVLRTEYIHDDTSGIQRVSRNLLYYYAVLKTKQMADSAHRTTEELSAGESSHTKKLSGNSIVFLITSRHPRQNRPERTSSSSTLLFFSQFDRKSSTSTSVTMAPKSKKSGDNINSRLALVMKSGKGTFDSIALTDMRITAAES